MFEGAALILFASVFICHFVAHFDSLRTARRAAIYVRITLQGGYAEVVVRNRAKRGDGTRVTSARAA